MLVKRRMQGDSEALLRVFIDQAPVPIAMFDRNMCYIAASRRWLSQYAFTDRNWRGVSHYEIFPDLPERWRLVHQRAQNGEVVADSDDRYERADGTVEWLRWECQPWYHAGKQGGIIIFFEDIGERKKYEQRILQLNADLEQRVQDRTRELEESVALLKAALAEGLQLRNELREQAIRDPLTGLFNRRFLEECMEHEMARAHRTSSSVGVIMLDLDRFKLLNDTQGHAAGDARLREVARVLAGSLRAGDVACRIGGDEFIVLLPDTAADGVIGKARHLRDLLNLTGARCSMGAAVYPRDGSTSADLIRTADAALYRDKKKTADEMGSDPIS